MIASTGVRLHYRAGYRSDAN